MADPDQPSVKADALAQPLNFIAELMQASPPVTRGSVFAILLASQINRVRLFQARRDGYTKVLERRVGRDVADSEAEAEAGRLTSLDQAVRDAMAELTNLGGVRRIDIALDLTVGSADEALSTVIDTDPLLEGQDLSTLSSQGPTPATSVAEFELPTDESYLSAAEAAAMLGVAKSTITRRIEKGEIIGFRGFKSRCVSQRISSTTRTWWLASPRFSLFSRARTAPRTTTSRHGYFSARRSTRATPRHVP